MNDKKIIFISINYYPEPSGFAPHVRMVAEFLKSKHNSISIITGFPFAPKWKKWDIYRNKYFICEQINGVDVHRVTHFIPRTPSSLLQRIMMEGSFSLQAIIYFVVRLSSKSFDLCVYVGAQPSVAFFSKLLAKYLNIPFIVEINDIASLAASDVGIIKSKWFTKLLYKFEFWSYKESAGAIVLCDAFKTALIKEGYSHSKIEIIRSPVDLELVKPVESDGFFRRKFNLNNKKIFLYTGTMGLKQGLLNILKVAKYYKDKSTDLVWILVGEGETKQDLVSFVEDHSLASIVYILPFQEEKFISNMYADADFLVLNQIKNMKDTVIPSKLLTYMVAGKPILGSVNLQSQASIIMREANGGILVEPEDIISFSHGVEHLLNLSSQEKIQMGENNRLYAKNNFDMKLVLQKHRSFYQKVINGSVK